MKFLKRIRAWWRGLFRKRRFSMFNATDNSEEWHIHLSPASVFAGLVAFVLLLFILTLSLVAYSHRAGVPARIPHRGRPLAPEALLPKRRPARLDGADDDRHDDPSADDIALIMEGSAPPWRRISWPRRISSRIEQGAGDALARGFAPVAARWRATAYGVGQSPPRSEGSLPRDPRWPSNWRRRSKGSSPGVSTSNRGISA